MSLASYAVLYLLIALVTGMAAAACGQTEAARVEHMNRWLPPLEVPRVSALGCAFAGLIWPFTITVACLARWAHERGADLSERRRR